VKATERWYSERLGQPIALTRWGTTTLELPEGSRTFPGPQKLYHE
jgi:hypothetical protein